MMPIELLDEGVNFLYSLNNSS